MPIDVDPNSDVDGSNVNSILEPTVGMEFDSKEEVKSFYKTYALERVFSGDKKFENWT